MLRLHFLHHRKLLPKLCRCVWDSLTIFLHKAPGCDDVFPGGILVPQTFGGMACWDRKASVYAGYRGRNGGFGGLMICFGR
ncbi:MAG: hypothetical protein KAW14_14170 [Candidatus Aegiribacteria sp.]|nr:hypothetical protein [Candidatus Aegiribacteria sp.]